MHILSTFANIVALVVFLWLAYKATMLAVATPSRCNLLDQAMAELDEVGVSVVEAIQQLTKPLTVQQLPAAVESSFGRVQQDSICELPSLYQPATVLRRVVRAKLLGDAGLAWDELSHWQRRLSFNYQHHRYVATHATQFGLLFTVVGVLLACATVSHLATPFQMFGAVGLAMVTTIAGLLLSLLVTHVLMNQFGKKLRELQIESERVALDLLQSVSTLQFHCQHIQEATAGSSCTETKKFEKKEVANASAAS